MRQGIGPRTVPATRDTSRQLGPFGVRRRTPKVGQSIVCRFAGRSMAAITAGCLCDRLLPSQGKAIPFDP